MYVDDLVSGSNTIEEVEVIKKMHWVISKTRIYST